MKFMMFKKEINIEGRKKCINMKIVRDILMQKGVKRLIGIEL